MDQERILRETFVASAEHHESLGSTNDRARHCAVENPPLPRLITANRQTAGRGRGTNRWWTGPGSLAMSLLLPAESVPADRGRSALLSLATGVALVETLGAPPHRDSDREGAGGSADQSSLQPAPTAPLRSRLHLSAELGLHWPNDVVLSGRKLAGILIEALPNRMHVVGIGVNTNNTAADAPPEIRQRLVTLRDATGATCDHTELVVGLLQRLELRLHDLQSAPERVAALADELCLQRGRTLTIRLGEEEIAGRCRGIAPDGGLLLDTPNGPRVLLSGVVQ
jgi:BirA family transcriptional regulator, biotin operon repressor / biotin---[acetyl-CoA-carboxylase] ligase